MRKTILSLFTLALALWTSCPAQERLHLREKFSEAKAGDYVVTSQNRTHTLLLITDVSQGSLHMEEVSIPEECFPAGIGTWRKWLEKGAPGHTHWMAYSLSLQDGRLIDAYSYSRNAWCESVSADNFLATLLNLPLVPMETKYRRRVGSLPGEGPDSRGFWQPRLVVNGCIMPNASFNAWRTRWPNDGTELAGKNIEVYLPHSDGSFPTYFPYWLQVSGAMGKARMRVIDSGSGLKSPKPPMPMRPPLFLNNGRIESSGLKLWLKRRPYHGELILTAIDAKDKGQGIPLSFSLQQTEQEDVVLLQVPHQELLDKLAPGRRYLFSIRSWKHPSLTIETADPLLWKPM